MPPTKRKRDDEMKNSWRTTKWLWNYLKVRYDFVVDLAADTHNHLLPVFLTKQQNSLNIPWSDCFGRACEVYGFCNPPYKKLGPWFEKADRESSRGRFGVVMVVPAFNGEKRWLKHVFGKAKVIYVVPHRIAFGDPETGLEGKAATFGTMVIVWAPRQYGDVVKTQLEVIT